MWDLRRNRVTISFGNFSATHHPSRRATGCAPRPTAFFPGGVGNGMREMVTNFIHKEEERRIQLQWTLPNLRDKNRDSISTVSPKLGPFANLSPVMFFADSKTNWRPNTHVRSLTLKSLQRRDDGQITKRLTSICDGR